MAWTSQQATQELLHLLPILIRIVAAEVREAAGEETTMPQYRVLAQLAAGPMTMSALAKRRRVSLQSMSGLVQSLVERGWISRTPDSRDRRQHLLLLTEAGRQHHARAEEQILRRLLPLMDELSLEELAAVEQALPALGRVLTQEDSDAILAPAEEIPA